MVGDAKKSLELNLEVYEKRKKYIGENDLDTIETL